MRGIVNIHLWSRRLKVMQLLESIFFMVIIAAFVLVIPMKARRTESQKEDDKKSIYFASQRFTTGERQVESESLSSEKWNQVFEWSDQLSIETDQGPGEKE
jgi:hypothetical protein